MIRRACQRRTAWLFVAALALSMPAHSQNEIMDGSHYRYGEAGFAKMLSSRLGPHLSDAEKRALSTISIEFSSIKSPQPVDCFDPLNFTYLDTNNTVVVCSRNILSYTRYAQSVLDISRFPKLPLKIDYIFDYARVVAYSAEENRLNASATSPCPLFEYVVERIAERADANEICFKGSVQMSDVSSFVEAHPDYFPGSEGDKDDNIEVIESMLGPLILREALYASVLHEIGHVLAHRRAVTLCDVIKMEQDADNFSYVHRPELHQSDSDITWVPESMRGLYTLAILQNRTLDGANRVFMLRLIRLADRILYSKGETAPSIFSPATLDLVKQTAAARIEEARRDLAKLKPCDQVLDFGIVRARMGQ